ncbi:uncharacterized protein [Amphiura filiformis]
MDLSKKQPDNKDPPTSQPENTSFIKPENTSFIKQSGLFDDFKKCIEGFDETADANGYADVYSKVEELKRNAKAGREGGAINGLPKKDEMSFQEVTRYNILDGTIMHCHEQSYSQDGRLVNAEQKLATAACSNQNEGPFLRSLLQKKAGESGDGETSSVGSPSQATDADNSQDKSYLCKVCKKQYASKSSLRKHFCFPTSEEANGQQLPQMGDAQRAPPPPQLTGIRIKQEIPEGQVPNGITPSQPIPTFFVKTENGTAAAAAMPPPMLGDRQFVVPTPPGVPGVPGEDGEEIFTCPVCSMTFKHSSHLMRHRRTHTNERPFECTDCHQAFRRKCHLKRHWQRIHSGEKPFKCAICGKAFSDRDHQRQHETIHGPETYPCFRCRSVFPSENYLLNHLADNPECKAALARDGDISPRRMRGKHKGQPTAYKCGLCGELFKKLRQIQTHQRVRHHDVFEKKYKCNLCGKGFDLISDLTHHRNNHAVRSKLDVDKNGEVHHPPGFRAPAHGPHGPININTAGIGPLSTKGVQNKAQLLDMLQQLEKRIQQQQQQVKKIETQQEQMSQEMVDPEVNNSSNLLRQVVNSHPQLNGTEIRYMLETRGPDIGHDLSMAAMRAKEARKAEGMENGGSPAKRPRQEPEAIDLSTKSSPPIRDRSPDDAGGKPAVLSGAEISVTVAAHMAKENFDQSQTKAILNLMSDNRHKCEQCGLSFLLYSEFRAHRKRHERARAAMCKEEHSEHSSELLAGNPEADRSLCRDCCSQDAPAVSPRTSPQGGAGSQPNGDGKDVVREANGDHQRHCARGHHNRVHESTTPDNRPRPCDGCLLLREQLNKEREEKETLRQEIDRLREALVSYAEAAASHESPLRGSSELTAMFNRLTAIRTVEEAKAASVK